METTTNLLSAPISLEEMEQRFSKAVSGVLRFFEFDCCIDTIPPIPPGGGPANP